MADDLQNPELRAILDRLINPDENPVTRARRMVEREVPLSRRGPGWDRHWRELEAYLEGPAIWSDKPVKPTDL